MLDAVYTGELAVTGITGLDNVLHGGLTAERLYLVQGTPGAGKTTLALQFLLTGVAQGERGLYITLSETAEELRGVAASHGWSLDDDKLKVSELNVSEENLGVDVQYTMFHPSEVELSKTTQTVLAEVERLKPKRVVFDSLAEIRMLAQDPLRYRRQVLALKHFFSKHNCTALLLDDSVVDSEHRSLHSAAHGVIYLEHLSREYGVDHRRLRVIKMRGRTYRPGYHDFNIEPGGLAVFPRLVAAEHSDTHSGGAVTSGVETLDEMLGGGLERGTGTMLIGPTGAGKSTISAHFAAAAAKRGDKTVVFTFDERRGTYLNRAKGIGLDLASLVEKGTLTIQQVDPAQLSPGGFEHTVRTMVEEGVRVLVIDSLNGYLHAMPSEASLLIQFHELFTFLGRKGVTTLLIVTQPGLIGESITTPVNASYLVDSVIMLRYFERSGCIRKAISVLKKRNGPHQRDIRELHLGEASERLRIGEVLEGLEGILRGTPVLSEPGEIGEV